jgi:hypothetical protein
MSFYNRNGFQGARSYGNQRQQPQGQRQSRDCTGKVWQNQKSQHPKAPQFTGVCTVAGVEYYISMWFQFDPQRGDTFSLKLEPKQQARRQQQGNGGYAPQPQQQRYGQPIQNAYMAHGPQNGAYGQPENAPQQGSAGEPPVNGPEDYGFDPFEHGDRIPF